MWLAVLLFFSNVYLWRFFVELTLYFNGLISASLIITSVLLLCLGLVTGTGLVGNLRKTYTHLYTGPENLPSSFIFKGVNFCNLRPLEA